MTTYDWYASFAELTKTEREGQDYRRFIVKRRSGIAVVAPHGGGIEPGTTELARAIAGRVFSCYTFDGIKASGNNILHITSMVFDEPECLLLVRNSRVAVAIHGCEGKEALVHVGGIHAGLKQKLVGSLGRAGFEAREASDNYSGIQPQNLCNRGQSGQGVQLELSEGLRRAMFKGLGRQERKIVTPIFRRFVSAVRKTLLLSEKEMGIDHGLLYLLYE